MKSKRRTPEILHRGSLMTYQDNGRERCFGYMLHFAGHGVYEPTFGRLDVSPVEAQQHNRLLSQAELEELDNNCAVGLGGMFYTKKAEGRTVVVTWIGQEVSQAVEIKGSVLTFRRNGMKFRGRLREREDCLWFKRVQ